MFKNKVKCNKDLAVSGIMVLVTFTLIVLGLTRVKLNKKSM